MHKPTAGHSGMTSRQGWLLAAASLVVSAAIVQVRSRKAERANPPAGRFVEVDGVRLHYVEVGSGEPLVLLHGNTTMGTDFLLSDLVSMAARSFRVIVFDRPGYGHSERPRGTTVWGPEAQANLILRALRQINAERAIVLGHSWGALVAVAMALQAPETVRGIVLEAGYFYPTLRPEVPLAAPPAIPVLGDLMRYTISPLLFRAAWPAMVKHLFAPAKVPDHFWEFPAWMAARPFQLRSSAAEIAMVVPAAMMLSRRYKDLSVPVVIIAGQEDRLVHQHAHSQRLHDELPWADFRFIPGMGHMLHHLVPDLVMESIEAADRQSGARAVASAEGSHRPSIH